MKLLGFGQKMIIKTLIKETCPNCITTSIPIYKKGLAARKVGILPLFGNIPIYPVNRLSHSNNDRYKVIHFGSFTSAIEDYKSQLEFLVKASSFEGKQVEFLVVGEGGPNKAQALEMARSLFGKANVVELGLLPAQEVSSLFQSADIGVSKSDLTLLGKSGSTLSMLEHGLPVLLRGQRPKSCELKNLQTNYVFQLFFVDSDFTKIKHIPPFVNALSETAGLFQRILQI